MSAKLSEELERMALLQSLRARMEEAHLFFPDVWEILRRSPVEVLREIAASNFEKLAWQEAEN